MAARHYVHVKIATLPAKAQQLQPLCKGRPPQAAAKILPCAQEAAAQVGTGTAVPLDRAHGAQSDQLAAKVWKVWAAHCGGESEAGNFSQVRLCIPYSSISRGLYKEFRVRGLYCEVQGCCKKEQDHDFGALKTVVHCKTFFGKLEAGCPQHSHNTPGRGDNLYMIFI